MTDTERRQELERIHQQLTALITADEADTYPFLEHLADLIQDLTD